MLGVNRGGFALRWQPHRHKLLAVAWHSTRSSTGQPNNDNAKQNHSEHNYYTNCVCGTFTATPATESHDTKFPKSGVRN